MFSSWLNRFNPEVSTLLLLPAFSLPPFLLELFQAYVWHEPKHIISLFICYLIALVTDLIILNRSDRLTLLLLKSTCLGYLAKSFGALGLLMLGTAARAVTPFLYYMPDLCISVIVVGVVTVCINNFSRLGVINRQDYRIFKDKLDGKLTDKIEHLPAQKEEILP